MNAFAETEHLGSELKLKVWCTQQEDVGIYSICTPETQTQRIGLRQQPSGDTCMDGCRLVAISTRQPLWWHLSDGLIFASKTLPMEWTSGFYTIFTANGTELLNAASPRVASNSFLPVVALQNRLERANFLLSSRFLETMGTCPCCGIFLTLKDTEIPLVSSILLTSSKSLSAVWRWKLLNTSGIGEFGSWMELNGVRSIKMVRLQKYLQILHLKDRSIFTVLHDHFHHTSSLDRLPLHPVCFLHLPLD